MSEQKERDEFERWWTTEDTGGLSSACKFSAWNAWLHQANALSAKDSEIALAVAKEREECAKVCEEIASEECHVGHRDDHQCWGDVCAANIRSLPAPDLDEVRKVLEDAERYPILRAAWIDIYHPSVEALSACQTEQELDAAIDNERKK